jgi:hypothetical protein
MGSSNALERHPKHPDGGMALIQINVSEETRAYAADE